MRRARKVGVILGAASTGLSACLYFLDWGTTLHTLATYYYYQYECPRAAQPLPPRLRQDPFCRLIRTDPGLYTYPILFWGSVVSLLAAYPTCAFIFWTSLPPRQQPLRLAYFMPLIHLHHLYQLIFRHGFSFKKLEDLQRGQREVNSLYNALGAALETTPQFYIQMIVAVKLGETTSASADLRVRAPTIPTTLVLSLVASLVSGFYSSGMAVSLIIGAHVPSVKRKAVAVLAGCQMLALMLADAMTITALAQFFHGFSVFLLIYVIGQMLIAWVRVGGSYRRHYSRFHGKSLYFKIVHSFVLAKFSRFISPIYVSVKDGKSFSSLILGSVLPILMDLMMVVLVILRPGHLKEQPLPCHTIHITESNTEWNKFLTCKLFLGTLFSSLFVVMLTTLIFIWLTQSINIARFMSNSSYNTQHECMEIISSIKKKASSNIELRSLHQMSTPTLLVLILVVITIIFIQKLQKKCIN